MNGIGRLIGQMAGGVMATAPKARRTRAGILGGCSVVTGMFLFGFPATTRSDKLMAMPTSTRLSQRRCWVAASSLMRWCITATTTARITALRILKSRPAPPINLMLAACAIRLLVASCHASPRAGQGTLLNGREHKEMP